MSTSISNAFSCATGDGTDAPASRALLPRMARS